MRIEHFKLPEEIVIAADADGLRYLSVVCSRLTGKPTAASKWRLKEETDLFEQGTIDLGIYFVR